MLIGDMQEWVDSFVSFDDRFLERIAAAWPACLAVLPEQPEEDDITINLVDHLTKDVVVRRLCHWVEYQFEPFGLATDGSKYSKGIIDIAVLFDWERERYLAYECKRLNVINGGSRSSLATLYVTQGMMRFLTEQYAEQLPVGCMLGYVLDGDVPFAKARLASVIRSHPPLAVIDGPTPLASIDTVERFQTRHTRPAGLEIELRHALFSYPSMTATIG
ncbi:hypothetical protein RFM41_30110 [Mesorhizobium sp. VK25A]|uniref:Restriction endonuclease n=2 Tax=Mesorhizobium TaxID=68287 RepID=A0ABU5ACU5_9HYPH|nr:MULTISPECIES: hypothetical protein [unclassified Mesorhizobium]MDX8480822.1 hypothetical protein [Mesorhizobium sp. VK24D]MDX8502277.1 hypothetical protein [Mesorhizobium sp. VK4C]MDX8535300.1 hypothetical protein [Mesorhizobium sp. VK25D]MDX8548029.1 hypothetical protein [Mesorhizobium sp. VK25A]